MYGKILQFLLVILVFVNCNNTTSVNSANNSEWVGTYSSFEVLGHTVGGSPIMQDIKIIIYKTNDKLKFLYLEDGWQTLTRIECSVIVKEDKGEVIFNKWGVDNIGEIPGIKKGKKIFNITRKDKHIELTNCGKMYDIGKVVLQRTENE